MSYSSSWADFPPVPAPGKITLGEYGTQLISVESDPENPADGRDFSEKILNYLRIDGQNTTPIFTHKIPSIKTVEVEPRQTFVVPKDEGILKGLWDSSREAGWRGIEQYLRKVHRNSATNVLFSILSSLAMMVDRAQMLKHHTAIAFFPHLGMSNTEIIQVSSQVRNWHKSWLKALSWHPNFSKLAIALQDDSVRICTVGDKTMPLLRCANQKNISSISWRPHSGAQLALGVDTGIIVWCLESGNSLKPGGCHTKFFSVKNHAPVTSVEYSSSGLLLLSSSSFDTSIYIWDAMFWYKTPLRRLGGGGVPLAIWSPTEDRILTTSPTSLFRIWDRADKWTPRRWTTPKGSIEAACWNHDGSTLLFATSGTIFAIHFALNDIDKFIHDEKQWVAVPIFSIAEDNVLCEDKQLEYKIGGRVRKLQLDSTGNRLAVLFEDSELVALFRVQPKSLSYLAPCGFVRGFPNEYPVAIDFQKDFSDGALLTIAWNSGRLQYLPIIFAQCDRLKNLLHQDHYKVPTVVRNAKVRDSITQKSNGKETTSKPSFHTRSSFRTSSFIDPPEVEDYEYVANASGDPPRLFSLGNISFNSN